MSRKEMSDFRVEEDECPPPGSRSWERPEWDKKKSAAAKMKSREKLKEKIKSREELKEKMKAERLGTKPKMKAKRLELKPKMKAKKLVRTTPPWRREAEAVPPWQQEADQEQQPTPQERKEAQSSAE